MALWFSCLFIILSYKINLSGKVFGINFLEGKTKEQKRKILNHLIEAFALFGFVFILLALINDIKHPNEKGISPYFLGFFICISIQIYISTKIPKKNLSEEEQLKRTKSKKLKIALISIIFIITIISGIAGFLLKTK